MTAVKRGDVPHKQNSPGSVLALVPARTGSKNPPDKNTTLFRGKPLLVHSIEHGLAASSVDRVLVSTDGERIAEIARANGAEVPFLRPAEISQDDSTDLETFIHALNWLKTEEDYIPEMVVHLRPTSPVRPTTLIDVAVSRLRNNPEADSLRTVIPAPITPYKMWRLCGKWLDPLLTDPSITEPYNMPRQALPVTYWQNAHLDVIRTVTIVKNRSMTGDKILAHIMSPEDDVDIDSQRDFDSAELHK